MVERSPLIWALLDDGIRRALSNPDLENIFRNRVSLHLAESMIFLKNTRTRFQTIYLDPMYPHRKKSALNKMRLRLLRSVVGDDEDSSELLTTARNLALQRVVVKRPANAPFIGQKKPSYAAAGKNIRYDVYLTNHL
jgi:16S rRNA (guanine1516-N2)-methyltransferase